MGFDCFDIESAFHSRSGLGTGEEVVNVLWYRFDVAEQRETERRPRLEAIAVGILQDAIGPEADNCLWDYELPASRRPHQVQSRANQIIVKCKSASEVLCRMAMSSPTVIVRRCIGSLFSCGGMVCRVKVDVGGLLGFYER